MKAFLAVVSLIAISHFAQAGLFKITDRQITKAGGITAAETAVMNAYLDRLENEVNARLPNADASNYLRGIADSTVTSGSGIGVDYASPFSLFIVGPQVGAGAKLGEGNSTKKLIKGDVKADRIQGVGLQGAIMAGLNLGFLPNVDLGIMDTERLKLFAHFFTYKHTFNDINAKTSSFGIHAQYNVMRPRKVAMGLLRWGGVDVTTGFKTTNLEATVSKRVKETKTETITELGGATVAGTVEGILNVGTKTRTYTVPLEVSTNVRLAYIFGLFGGLGMDLNFGSSKAAASVNAPFSFSATGGYAASGNAALDLGQKKAPRIADVRYFIGPHIELGVLSINVQYTQAFISDTIGVSAGIKAFW